jgi:1-aminocyclopropane-1-carboxylate deaminase
MDYIFDTSKSILQELKTLQINGNQIFVKRDDLIHEHVSGNKWRKLKYNILQAQANNKTGILTFGGAFSNHLLATASACKALNFKSIGIVRGDELTKNSNKTLTNCTEFGMDLHFINRDLYKQKTNYDYLNELKTLYPDFYFVPEGGSNYYGMIGCQEIIKEINLDFNHMFVALGTTCTSCGILLSLKENQKLHVIPVLKGFDALTEMKKLFLQALFDEETIVELMTKLEHHDNYHFGGYGKKTSELVTFIAEINHKYGIPLDQVYTAKAFYGMLNELKKQRIQNKKIVFIHTGGLQGNSEH